MSPPFPSYAPPIFAKQPQGPTAADMAQLAQAQLASQPARLPLPDIGDPAVGDGGQISPGMEPSVSALVHSVIHGLMARLGSSK